MEREGGDRIVTIYADVLVGLNIYITWFLLLAAEALAGCPGSRWRRGAASVAGGLSSLSIFLPELPFWALFLGKLLLAGGITWIAGGRGGFFRRMAVFFGANFLFAGVMVAIWLLAAPPRLTIRNGVVYYHIPALTLAASTIVAYGIARFFAYCRSRSGQKEEMVMVCAGLEGREVLLRVLVDTGNRLAGPGGLPVLVCSQKALEGLVPKAVLAFLAHPWDSEGIPSKWRPRLRFIPCETVGGSGLLAGFAPDFLRTEDGGQLPCLLAVSQTPIRGDYQAVGGVVFARDKTYGKEAKYLGKGKKAAGIPESRSDEAAGASPAMRLHKRATDSPSASDPGGGAGDFQKAGRQSGESQGNPDHPESAAGGLYRP